jgi:outer membrane receptor protein involved in Fe transport
MFALAAASAFGQDTTASIIGTVTDASGAAVVGAKVTVFNVDQQREEMVLNTNGSGGYVAADLPVGKHRVTFEAPGFKRQLREDVVLDVNDKLTVSAKLEVGDVKETVTVEEAAVNLQLQSSEQSTTVNGTQIRELALVTRNYEELVSLMPGVVSASVDQLYVGTTLPSGQTATIPFAINGARNSASAWLVDGADNIDRGSNLTLQTTPSIDAIAEFKVQRSGYSAESGRAGGAQISVVTKSGTNALHGDAYEFVRNGDFNANNFYNNATSLNLGTNGKAQVSPMHYNNFGYTAGGPVYIPKVYNGKNKTFFFFSEEFRRYITYASGTATLPTASEVAGNFPNPVCVQYTGSTCALTSTSIAKIDPIAAEYVKDIFSKIPLPTGTNTYNSLFRNVYNFRQEMYKVDHVFSPKLQVSFRYLRDSIPTTEPQGLFTNLPVQAVSQTSTNAPGHNMAVRATSTLTPTWLNEAGYNYSYSALISDPTGLISPTNSPDIKVSLPFTATLAEVPYLTFSSGTAIQSYGPYRDYSRNHNAFDNVTKILGSHTLRFGASYNHYQKKENAASGNQGGFAFTPASTPAGATQYQQAFANFLLGNVATFTQASEDVTPDIRANQFEMYAQDDWRIRTNLTLSFGVRYSNFRQPVDNNNQLTNFDPAVFNPSAAATITSTGVLASNTTLPYLNGIIGNGLTSPFGKAISTQNNSNFAPRAGFAWDPWGTGKNAIRGGYGIFYDATLYGIYEQNIFANPPYVNSISIPNVTLDNPSGGTASVSFTPKALHATPVQFETPYSQQWSLEFQHQFDAKTILNVGYVGTKGTHLLGEVDLNEVPAGLAYTSGLVSQSTVFTSANEPLLNAIRPYPGYNAINALETWFNSNYNALQIYGQRRFNADALVSFSYTWSKALTDNQSDRSTAAQNLYNAHDSEYGPAQYDRTQVFNMNLVYTLPFFKTQHGFKGKALGGWELSAIGRYNTGLPYTVTTSGTDPAGLGIIGSSAASLRPNLVCDPTVGAPQTRSEWFNTACFANVPAGVHVPGNSGRGVIRGPGYEGWSMRAAKNLIFKERFRFQLLGEASNVFNHTNPSTFGSLSTASTLFGTVTGYRDPRTMQLGGKFYF